MEEIYSLYVTESRAPLRRRVFDWVTGRFGMALFAVILFLALVVMIGCGGGSSGGSGDPGGENAPGVDVSVPVR
jgi:hypothetical protein